MKSTYPLGCLWDYTATQWYTLAWRTLVQHINAPWMQSSMSITQDRRMLCWWYRHKKPRNLADLRRVFDIMRAYQLKMNPAKSFLRVASGKFLEFVVTSKGIHLDLEKIHAVQEMQLSRNLKELRGLQGRLAYIRRFISNLSGWCQPFTKLIKKGVSFIWDNPS